MNAAVAPPIGPVLVVDDNADMRVALVTMLRAMRYRTVEADNGRIALDWLLRREERPALILLDLMMPVMDGVELRRRLLREHTEFAAIPVVLVSAFTAESHVVQLAAADFLRKPIDLQRMLQLVDRHCVRAA
jgi:CheY-like chemotaxis protein